MGKTTTLLKNTVIIGIGSLGTKILTFFLLPLYTILLSPDDYGTIDVLITITSLIIPFVSLEIGSGVFRFIIEKNQKEVKEIISTGFFFELIGLSLYTVVMFFLNIYFAIPHVYIFTIYVITATLMTLITNTIRGLGDNLGYSIGNFLTTLVALLLNLILIIGIKMGGEAILISTIIGNIVGILVIFIRTKLWRYISIRYVRILAFGNMLKYTLPLIPNAISWWIVSASDRLLILFFLGASANGIYAAANKIPGIYTTIFSVYSLAWTEAVARNVDDHFFISNTFKKSINVMMFMLLGIITSSSLFFDVLIGAQYSESYWHILLLLLAIFFSSGSSLLGAIFLAKMQSRSIAQTTILGAVFNILINIVLIQNHGLYAASLSTLIAYFIVFIIRFIQCNKWYELKIFPSKKMFIVVLFICVVCGYYTRNVWFNIFLIPIIVGGFIVSNKEEVTRIVKRVLKNN